MALDEVGVKLIVEGQRAFENALDKAGSLVGGFLKVGAAAAAAGVGAVSTVIAVSMNKTLEWGQTLDNIGDVLGTTSEESAGLASMFRIIGADSGQLTQAIAIMSKGLTDAKGELGPTGKALQSMGLDFKDASGKVKPATVLFQEIADKLGPMPEGMEKTALMMDLFGKSGKEMGDALNAAAKGGMNKYIAQAKAMGLAIDADQIIKTKMDMQTLGLAIEGLAVKVGIALLPILQNAIAWVQANWPTISAVFQQVWSTVSGILSWIGGVISSFIATVSGWWQENGTNTVSVITNTWNTIQGIIASVAGVIQSIVNFVTGAIAQFWEANGEKITTTVQSAWGLIQSVIASISGAIQSVVGAFLAAVQQFWADHGAAILAAVQTVWNTIQSIINTVVGIITSIVQAFISAFQGDWTAFGEHLRTAWDQIWAVIVNIVTNIIPTILGIIGNFVQDIINKFISIDWGAVGRSIIEGIGNGISAAAGWLVNAARNAAQAALDAAKGFFGIGSPSKVMFEVGQNIMMGWEKGILKNIDRPARATEVASQMALAPTKVMSAGPVTNNYSTANNYNLSVMTSQSPAVVQRSFAMMKLLSEG